jgi:hypothetical protein
MCVSLAFLFISFDASLGCWWLPFRTAGFKSLEIPRKFWAANLNYERLAFMLSALARLAFVLATLSVGVV